MEDKALAQAAIWDDLKSFEGKPWRGKVDIITAGYPCQPFSFSGRRQGTSDPRHLWPDVARVISEVEPEWVFAENVEGHLNLGCSEVCQSLRDMGFTPKAGMFSAREAGASHRRGRIFILAHADRKGQRPLCRSDDQCWQSGADQDAQPWAGKRWPDAAFKCREGMDGDLADAQDNRLVSDPEQPPLFAPGPADLLAWQRIIDQFPYLQPAILRDNHGMANRMDEYRAAGNGVCSMAAALAWAVLKADFNMVAGGFK